MIQIPLLFLCDSPAMRGGLSRIGRDIAFVASRMEEFRVGYMGRGVLATRKLPYMQYPFGDEFQWGEELLQPMWEDFSGGEDGIVMTIWDPSRLHWLANPVGMPNEEWLKKPPFQKWGYFPVDAHCPSGALTTIASDVVRRYHRVLGYGSWGAQVLEASTGKAVDWLPHGFNGETFKPRDGAGVRAGLGIPQDTTLIGCVMTNQERKDWGLAFATISQLRAKVKKLKAWFKVDSVDRHWDMRALTADYALDDVVLGDMGDYKDLDLSYMYSACNATFLPPLGEGFGYPIVESLACGTPCIHGTYGGGAELVPKKDWLVDPVAMRIDTRFNCLRPVYNPKDWSDALERALAFENPKEFCCSSVEHLNWANLYIPWQKWFRKGLLYDGKRPV